MSPRCKKDGALIPRYEDWHKKIHGTKSYGHVLDLCNLIATKRGEASEERALRVVQETLDSTFLVKKATETQDHRGFDLMIYDKRGNVLPLQVKSSHTGRYRFEKKSNVPVIVVNPGCTDAWIGQYVAKFVQNFFCV